MHYFEKLVCNVSDSKLTISLQDIKLKFYIKSLFIYIYIVDDKNGKQSDFSPFVTSFKTFPTYHMVEEVI